jgi:hypothetical protein
MATPSRVDQLLQLTEVIWTAASFAVCFLQEVASTAAGLCRCQLAAVKFTDGNSGHRMA